jgi:hypothetical protein
VPRCLFTIACRKASIEAHTSVLSLFEIIEELTVPADARLEAGPTLVQPAFELVTQWERAERATGERRNGRFCLRSPDGQDLVGGPFVVDLSQHLRARIVAQVPGIPYCGPGPYRIVVELQEGDEWTLAGEYPIEVHGPPLPLPGLR